MSAAYWSTVRLFRFLLSVFISNSESTSCLVAVFISAYGFIVVIVVVGEFLEIEVSERLPLLVFPGESKGIHAAPVGVFAAVEVCGCFLHLRCGFPACRNDAGNRCLSLMQTIPFRFDPCNQFFGFLGELHGVDGLAAAAMHKDCGGSEDQQGDG